MQTTISFTQYYSSIPKVPRPQVVDTTSMKVRGRMHIQHVIPTSLSRKRAVVGRNSNNVTCPPLDKIVPNLLIYDATLEDSKLAPNAKGPDSYQPIPDTNHNNGHASIKQVLMTEIYQYPSMACLMIQNTSRFDFNDNPNVPKISSSDVSQPNCHDMYLLMGSSDRILF